MRPKCSSAVINLWPHDTGEDKNIYDPSTSLNLSSKCVDAVHSTAVGWSKKDRLCKVAKFEIEVHNATGVEVKKWPGGVKGLNPRFTFETEKNEGACAKEMCYCWASGADPSVDDPSGYVYGPDCDVGEGESPTCKTP